MHSFLRLVPTVAVVAASLFASRAFGQEEDEEEDLGRPGLRAEYAGARTVVTIDPRPTFDLPAKTAPVLECGRGGFEVRWTGRINVLRPGKYVFRAEVIGRVDLSIDGKRVLHGGGEGSNAVFVAGEPVELKYGQIPIAASFTKGDADGPARLRWFWRREREFESPIPAVAFNHKPAAPGVGIEPSHDAARRLFVDLRCGTCHLGAARKPEDSPARYDGLPIDRAASLDGVGDRLDEAWLYRWLDSPRAVRTGATMPDLFGDDPADRVDLYAAGRYLASLREKKKPTAEAAAIAAPGRAPDADADFASVRRSMASVGCIACHTLPGEDGTKFPALRSLDRLGDKYHPGSLRQRISEPRKFHPDSRMPDFRLVDEQPRLLDDIVDYLMAQRRPEAGSAPKAPSSEALKTRWKELFSEVSQDSREEMSDARRWLELGRRVVEIRRCTACHEIKNLSNSTVAVPAAPVLGDNTPVIVPIYGQAKSRGCLDPNPKYPAVSYGLSEDDRVRLVFFCRSVDDGPLQTTSPLFVAADQQRRNGCVNCHATDRLESPFAKRILSFVPLGTDQTMHDIAPPSLAGIGEKLTTKAITEVIDGKTRARPWMVLRMPHFKPEHLTGLADALVARDGIDPRAKIATRLPHTGHTAPADPAGDPFVDASTEPSEELLETGRQLVGRTGLNCVSCHDFRGVKSIGVRGPDLANVAKRIRPEWFEQWLLDPQRLAPGTRMPSVFFGGKSAAPQYLDGDPHQQLDALWGYLAAGSKLPLPSLAPPAAAIVAGGENPRFTPADKPLIVRGFMPGTAGLKGIAVGTPAGMHFAFDSERCALTAVWTGDFAEIGGWYDNGRGKPEENGLKPLGKIVWRGPEEPVFQDFTITTDLDSTRTVPRFRSISATSEGAIVEYDLSRSHGRIIAVREAWKPLDAGGFQRTFAFPGAPNDGLGILIAEADQGASGTRTGWTIKSSGQTWDVTIDGGRITNLTTTAADGKRLMLLVARPDANRPAEVPLRITYRLAKPTVPNHRN